MSVPGVREEVDRLLGLVPENGVLGLGEPTHGSANVSEWKMAVLAELSDRGALGALAFEDSMLTGAQVDRALADGTRCSDQVLGAWAEASSLWRTRVVVVGLERLASIAASEDRRRFRFLGLDCHGGRRAAQRLVALGATDGLIERLGRGEALTRSETESLVEECRFLEAASTAQQFLARNVRQYAEVYLIDPGEERLALRDRYMAEELLARRPDRGITVVWAHNEHVARNESGWAGPVMGAWLAEALGRSYVAVGALCGEGTARAVDAAAEREDYRSVALPGLRPEHTESALAALGQNLVRGDELAHPGPRRFLGWSIDSRMVRDEPGAFDLARPSTDFDLLRWFSSSTADETWVPDC
ncbi:erythromycin esterase family protein [Actinomyces radicidentis]|uniref:erythromycin esterase family protein n=1 Tax=Actinomyces radicidentis TaxID=111015 RepID=UPI0026E0E54E|nr:erythromycin esterase family protein [Actinomyces radicidentis]